jgi:hypothetical protein
MIRAYDEIVDLIAAGVSPEEIASFQASQETRNRVDDLIAREKSSGLSADESAELDRFMHLEHLMRLAKARARRHCSNDSLHRRGHTPNSCGPS